MELDAPANGDAAPVDLASEHTPVSESPSTDTPVDIGASSAQEEAQETAGGAKQEVDGAEHVEPSEDEEVVVAGAQEDVEMAEPTPDAASSASDPAASAPALTEAGTNEAAQQEREPAEKDEAAAVEGTGEAVKTATQAPEMSASVATESPVAAEETDHQEQSAVEDKPVDMLADNSEAVQPTAATETNAAWTEQQEAGSGVLVEETREDSEPTHDESEYDPSAPALAVASVPHHEDEYDPAKPSPAGTPVASNAPAAFASQRPPAEQEEYDPDHPAMTPSSSANEKPAAMEVDHTLRSSGEQSTMTPVKRKAEGDANASSDAAKDDPDSKRPRYVDDNKSDGDHKHGRHRRGSGDSTSSSGSKHKHHDEDHKGLSAAAWDRLMGFQTSGEFRVTQVSRAAFASVGAMPEFAQIAIIARFVRTPMRDVRDKNGQLMRIYREYQKENPKVAALQPVDAFLSDYKSDPGLFRFGYAPPQPAAGISHVQVPYQRDQPEDDTPVRNSPRQARVPAARPGSELPKKGVDEFGRVAHKDNPTALEPNGPSRTIRQRPAVDPRLASRSRQGPASPTTQALPRATAGGRAEDPRRRDHLHPQSSSGAGRDPRRRSSLATQQPSSQGPPGASRVAGSSDLYERLPAPVKAVVDSMRREGRLQEPLNDNVVTRLLHLPERVALQAVENFSNVDLSQVENLQGFLVGIINRVNEKAIASEKQHRPQPLVPSPRGHPPSALPRGAGYAAPAQAQGGSVLGGPPQGGRLNGSNGPNSGAYRGQPTPMAAGPAPALYERPYEAPQDPRDPRRRQPAPQVAPEYGGAVRGPPPVGAGRGGPIGMQSFTVLPMSVQNHVHSLVANHTLASLEELGSKCYEVLGQLSEPLANQVLTRFAGANLSNVRNKSGFLVGVVKRARQEYGFN